MGYEGIGEKDKARESGRYFLKKVGFEGGGGGEEVGSSKGGGGYVSRGLRGVGRKGNFDLNMVLFIDISEVKNSQNFCLCVGRRGSRRWGRG